MRVLVTGATGFVGRYLLRLLLSRRAELFGTFLQRDFGEPPDRAKLFLCDLRRSDEVRSLVADIRPDHLYHLAALSSVQDSFGESRAFYDANFFGTLNLLEAVQASQPRARVLMVGSGHCYGKIKPNRMPITEKQPLAPDSPYGVSKAAADMLGSQFFQSYGLKVIRARPFNHTGPGQSPYFVCSDFARQFAAIDLGLMPTTVHVGNIDARRDFSDVRDVVRAYTLLLHRGKPGEAYNVSSGRAVPLRRILDILTSFCRREVKIEVEPKRVRRSDPDTLYGNSRKLRQASGWRPKYSLRTTLRDLYLYWKASLRVEQR